MERKLIFHIIHGSFVDGYGCRTTIFLKGCPLRCAWCCNPESQNEFLEVKRGLEGKCNGCAKCMAACPAGAIQLACENGAYQVKIDRKACTHCGKCAKACLTGELEMFGQLYSVDEVFNIIRRDEQYYAATGGGVTIGGGEPTIHGEFVLELINKCRDSYIHTALDTCGYITNPAGLQAFDTVDLALFDIKGIDPVKHKRNTGVDNTLILENLQRRNAMGKPVIIRVPVIPGFNADDEELDAIAQYIAGLRVVERVDLIPFHDYCRVKYAQLDRCYAIPESRKAMNAEEEAVLLAKFQKYHLPVQIGG